MNYGIFTEKYMKIRKNCVVEIVHQHCPVEVMSVTVILYP